MLRLRSSLACVLAAAVCVAASAADPPWTRAQALQALAHEHTGTRVAAIERLAEIGTMHDADALAGRLRVDDDAAVRELVALAMWQIWSRSGVPAIDALLQRGVEQMHGGELDAAVATFSEVIRRRPAFAEGWNKRATVLFMLGRDAESLKDCDEVLKRNRHHFGALSGMAQIHLRRGDPERALQAYQRALQINPNLNNAAVTLHMLEQAVRARRGQMI